MDLTDQLRIFISVAERGGFTAAANQLDAPRATVSLAIQQLEARLGARLFNRTTRRVTLTQDGDALLERASSLVSDADELQQLFKTQTAALAGRLRVDVPSRLARRVIAPALPAFLARHPQLQIELGSSDRAVDLVAEGIACALRVGTLAPSSLVAKPLGQLRMVNCASPAYLAHWGTPTSPQALKRHRAVLYAPPGEEHAAPWEWVEAGQARVLAMDGQVTVNNAETYVACALSGLGLIQVPAYDVRDALRRGELVEVLADWPAPAMPVHLVYPHRRYVSRRVQAFGVWLSESLAPLMA